MSSSSIARLLALGGELAPPVPGAPRRKYDLAHMRALLAALDSPERGFPAVLIAGTNGKGSTAAALASIGRAAGVRVGLYTSPHLETLHERIRVDAEPIAEAALERIFLRVEAASAALVASGDSPHTPSFFETMTAICFLHFAEAKVELAVLEVGMGGRLDATNVVEPLVSVITDISLDHMQWLGNTLTEIAREKAGILREGGVLVTLPQHPEVNQLIGEVAVPLHVQAVNAVDYMPGRDLGGSSSSSAETIAATLRNRYPLALPHQVLDGAVIQVDSPLAGSHQQRNLALAIATAVELHRRFGFPLTAYALESGLSRVEWPGRLQLVPASSEPRPLREGTTANSGKSAWSGPAPLLLDAAHNPAGAWTLRAALSSLRIDGPRTLIFGCMADKAIEELAQILFPVFDEVLLTTAGGPRAARLAALASAAEQTGAQYRTITAPTDALLAAQLATPAHGLVVVAGSVALLGQILDSLRR